MTTWIDTTVITIVVVVGLLIFYRALKEPVDMLLGGLKSMLGYVKDTISSSGEGAYDEVIKYG